MASDIRWKWNEKISYSQVLNIFSLKLLFWNKYFIFLVPISQTWQLLPFRGVEKEIFIFAFPPPCSSNVSEWRLVDQLINISGLMLPCDERIWDSRQIILLQWCVNQQLNRGACCTVFIQWYLPLSQCFRQFESFVDRDWLRASQNQLIS